MKKLFYILAFVFCSAICFGQGYPVSQSIGADSTLVTSKGGLKGRLINTNFTDTTAANLQRIRQYPGAQIYTSVLDQLWIRNSTATQWIEVGTGASGAIETYYGTIYNQDSWTNLDTFIATNVTASVVSGRISLAGGSSATDFTHSINLKYQTGLDRWKIIIKVVPTTKTASTFGIGIGTQSTSVWAAHGFDIVAKLDLSSGGSSGVISLQNNNGSSYSSVATSSALSFSANDTILFYLERRQDSLISVAQDLTSGSIVRANYQYITTSASNPMPNTGYFSLRSFGGTQLIDSMAVTSKGIKNITTMIGGDSKAFYFATAYKNVFANLVDHNIWSTNNSGGAAETSKDIIHRFAELRRVKPKKFVIETYSNDLRSGMTQQESFDSITVIYNTLTSYGIDVYFLPLYETSENLLPWYQFFKANWPAKVIESYQVMQTAGLLVDGTHFSTAGQDTLSKIIINSFLLSGGNNRYPLYNTLQGVTDAGNSTTNNVGINVLDPTIPLMVVHPTSAPAASMSISANTGTEVLKIENTNAGASAAAALRFYNNGGLNAQLSLGSSTNSVNPNGISFHSFTGAMRIGSNSDVFEIFTGVLGPSQSNVKARMLNNGSMAIGINPTPNASALFDVTSTTLGFLTPRMTTAQQNAIVSPASGLLIYNTDSAKHCYYTGAAWVCYGSGSATTPSWNSTMTVSPDLSSDYITNMSSHSWQLQNNSAFDIYSDAGSTTRLKIDNVKSDLNSPNGIDGIHTEDGRVNLHVNDADAGDGTIFQLEPVSSVWTSQTAVGTRIASVQIESSEDSITQVSLISQSESSTDQIIVGFDDQVKRGVLLFSQSDSIFFRQTKSSSALNQYKLVGVSPTGGMVKYTGPLNIYSDNGTLSGARTLTGGGNALTLTGLGLFTASSAGMLLQSSSDIVLDPDSLYIDALGIVSDTTVWKPTVYNTATKSIARTWWSSAGATPTFQQVLTAGSTLSGATSISGGSSYQWSVSGNYRVGAGSIDLNSDSVRIFTTTTATDTTVNKPAILDINTGTVRRTWWSTFGGGSGSTTWNAITNPTGTQTLSFDDAEINAWANGSNTETFQTITSNSLTTGVVESLTTNSLTTGTIANFVSTSTTLAAGNEALNIAMSGANGTSSITATGARISVTNTGTTNTNIALDATASGASTDNWAINATGNLKVTSANTTQATTSAGLVFLGNSLTTGTGLYGTTSSLTTGSLGQFTSTATTLAAGNEVLDIASSGANGTNAITATGIRSTVTNTNATSGTNVAGDFVASGATTGNYALRTTGSIIGNDFVVASSGISATPAMALRSTTNDVTGGIVLSNNANYVNLLYLAAGQIQANVDLRVDVLGGDLMFNSLRTSVGGTFTSTAVLHLAAGTATASTAPLKFTSGTNLTAVENGAVEYDGTDYFASAGGTRQTIAKGRSGSFSQVGTATTTFTVTFGGTQPNATYKVNVTPTAALSAALFYVTNKSTTSFDVVYLAGLTGTVLFDWTLVN